MYHYVRDLKNSRYPDIKGLDVSLFRGQIEYIKNHYNIISADQLMESVQEGIALPPRPLLLTFDDGYADHFSTVFPILDRQKLPGCFFPPAKCVLENQVLDVNKIHFILASVGNRNGLVHSLFELLEKNREMFGLESNDFYWEKCAVANRHDTAEVIFFKRMLQRELPLTVRSLFSNQLFEQYVGVKECAFAQELYMTVDQISCLQANGMYVGSHGYEHHWLDTISPAAQEKDIDLSLSFLKLIGSDTNRWMMCYPYGAHNESLLEILKKRRCAVGLTTEVDIAVIGRHDPLTLPRLDTNDLPIAGDASVSEWTMKARES